MVSRNRALQLALLAAALVVIGAQVSVSPGRSEGAPTARGQELPELRDPDYVGKLIGEPNGRALIRVDRRPDGTPKVIFQAQHIREICESGNEEGTFNKYPKSVGPRGRWESLFAVGPPDSFENQEFSLTKGRFLPGGKAKGYIFWMIEELDPGSANANDCWSDGVVRWRARKVKDGRGLRFDRQAESAQPRPIEPGRYEGEIPSYGKVSLEVRERAGRRIVSFETRLELYCESIYRMTKLGPFKARLRASGRFDRPIFVQHSRSKHRFFTWITGRIRASGEAEGRFAHFDDPWDPEGSPNVDECVTPRELPWRAERVGEGR